MYLVSYSSEVMSVLMFHDEVNRFLSILRTKFGISRMIKVYVYVLLTSPISYFEYGWSVHKAVAFCLLPVEDFILIYNTEINSYTFFILGYSYGWYLGLLDGFLLSLSWKTWRNLWIEPIPFDGFWSNKSNWYAAWLIACVSMSLTISVKMCND